MKLVSTLLASNTDNFRKGLFIFSHVSFFVLVYVAFVNKLAEMLVGIIDVLVYESYTKITERPSNWIAFVLKDIPLRSSWFIGNPPESKFPYCKWLLLPFLFLLILLVLLFFPLVFGRLKRNRINGTTVKEEQ